jgi:hypothetical protein
VHLLLRRLPRAPTPFRHRDLREGSGGQTRSAPTHLLRVERVRRHQPRKEGRRGGPPRSPWRAVGTSSST